MMQIEIFTICDNAQVYAGKAVVMGAFNQLKAKKTPSGSSQPHSGSPGIF